jgi:hypothetical protein
MRTTTLALGIALAMAGGTAAAATTDELIRQLQDRIEAQDQRIAELEAKQSKAPAPVAATPPSAAPAPAAWADKVALTGDFRYRYENIDQEGSTERNRQRVRARVAVVAKPQAGVEVGFGLATAQDKDPVSSNQTLGGGGGRKDIYLDLAYFNWTAAEGLNVMGGKFKNNMYRPGKHALIWDADFNPEGFGITYVNGPLFANAISTWLETDSAGTEAVAVGGQVGGVVTVAEGSKLTAGVGYVGINTAGKGAFFAVNGTPRFARNTVDGNNRYVNDYRELEAFAELGFKVLDLPGSVFVDFVKNTDAENFDTGWAAGAQLGAAKTKGSWEVSYTWQDLEKDAVFGLWTDSDFGNGGTDTTGHVFRGAYALSDRTNVALAYFMTEFGDNAGTAVDYDRLQLDLNFKY